MSKKKKDIFLPSLGAGEELIDTHCHLDMEAYSDDLEAVLSRSRRAGVSRIVTVGIDRESSEKAIRLAETCDGVYATVGVHPHNVQDFSDEGDYDVLRLLCRHEKVVAYGEIGLDYVKDYAPIPLQKEHFARQLSLAGEFSLPVVIHDREAHADILDMLKAAAPFTAGGVMHCFSGDAEYAREVLDFGFLISIPGVVTFSKAEVLQDAVRNIPLSSLILETDGPFLAPVPHRGRRNEPSYLIHTAQMVADLKGISLAEVARQTTQNAIRLFSLNKQDCA